MAEGFTVREKDGSGQVIATYSTHTGHKHTTSLPPRKPVAKVLVIMSHGATSELTIPNFIDKCGPSLAPTAQ